MTEPSEERRDRGSRTQFNGRNQGDEPSERIRIFDGAIGDLATKATGDAIADRVLAKLSIAAGLSSASGILFDDVGAVAPQSVAIIPASAGREVQSSIRPPSGAVLHPPPALDPIHRRWFVVQLWEEIRLAVRMYFDPHYRISRTAQFLFPAILVLFGINYLLFSAWFPIPIVGPILERAGCVLLGIFSYKVMARELVRYREVLDYLANYGPR